MNLNATLLAQLVVFFVLALFTMKFVWPPIVKALDERAQKIADGLSHADMAKQRLEEAHAHIELKLSETHHEAGQHLAKAEKHAAGLIDDAKERANLEAQKIIDAARHEAEQQILKAREVLREEVAALAVKGAEQILKREVNASVHADLLKQLKAEL